MIAQSKISLEPNYGDFLHSLETLSNLESLSIMTKIKELTEEEIDRIIEMAWEDRTPFDAILAQFGITEGETIEIMRRNMKQSSFKMWRARVQGRSTKHLKKSPEDMDTFKSRMQRGIAMNKISKR